MNVIAVIGSRDWAHPDRVTAYINALPDDAVIVTGGWWENVEHRVAPTRGVDFFAAKAARARGLTVVIVAADYLRYKRHAGFRRNPVTVGLATKVVAFWDGTSPGTKNSIEAAKKLGLDPEIVLPP